MLLSEGQMSDYKGAALMLPAMPKAKELLADKGYDPANGARPLARVIQEHIKKPLADEILFCRLVRGGHVKVELKDGKITFEIEPERGPVDVGERGQRRQIVRRELRKHIRHRLAGAPVGG